MRAELTWARRMEGKWNPSKEKPASLVVLYKTIELKPGKQYTWEKHLIIPLQGIRTGGVGGMWTGGGMVDFYFEFYNFISFIFFF